MDTGHVKQVATFEKLLGFCNAQGAMFNPSKRAIKATALNSLLTSAQLSLEAVKTARTEYINWVNARNQAFNGLPQFMTRMVNALAATEASEATVDDAYTFIRRFYRVNPRKIVSSEGETSGEPVVTHSRSHRDFDSRADNFEALVKVMSLEPSYQPNEVDLQVESLNARVTSLRNLNSAVINAHVVLSNARAKRNTFLYNKSGIHGLALAVKRYVKGVFGFRSVAYNQICSLRFANQKVA